MHISCVLKHEAKAQTRVSPFKKTDTEAPKIKNMAHFSQGLWKPLTAAGDRHACHPIKMEALQSDQSLRRSLAYF
jgi:hypothetical protein